MSGQTEGKAAAATVGVQALLVVAAFAAFLLKSPWLTPILLVFTVSVAYGWVRHQARTAHALTFMTTASTVVILGLIAFFILLEAVPTVRLMGFRLFVPLPDMWNPAEDIYSMVPMIWGTAVTTFVAMLVAAPLGVAGALFISEIAPTWAREIIKPAVETLAGIPSIVYGFIGFVLVNPWFNSELSAGLGTLVAIGFMIGLMALPTVVSVAEDALSSVPESMKSGSLAMGVTDWQTMKSVTVPAAFSGVSAAVLLGLGRAMGETMAATVMIAHSQVLPDPLYDVFANTETLTTLIAGNFGPAVGTEYYMSALFVSGAVLFVIVTGVGVVSQLIERRMKRKLGGKE